MNQMCKSIVLKTILEIENSCFNLDFCNRSLEFEFQIFLLSKIS